MDSDQPPVDLETKNKVALKLLGGSVPNVGFQLGVIEALQDRGFSIQTGALEPGESRRYGSTVLNPIIGSSSGSFAAIAAAMGYGREDLLGKTGRIKEFTESILKDSVNSNLFSFLKRFYTSRKKYSRLKQLVHSEPATYEHLINTYYPLWKMDSMEKYLRDELLNGCDFATLRTKLLILAVTQEQRLTVIFGDESRPRTDDYKFQAGVKPWKAAVASMCLPPYFQPYRLEDPPEAIIPPGSDDVVMIDGEARDAFSTDAAEESGADLIIVSSFYRVMEYSPELGHIDDYGILPVMLQGQAHGLDARKLNSIRSRRRRQRALRRFREYLREHHPEQAEKAMDEMEEILDLRENLDVIEIQAQEYQHDELTYPYWDPFTLDEDVLNFLFDAGYEVATSTLNKRLRSTRTE